MRDQEKVEGLLAIFLYVCDVLPWEQRVNESAHCCRAVYTRLSDCCGLIYPSLHDTCWAAEESRKVVYSTREDPRCRSQESLLRAVSLPLSELQRLPRTRITSKAREKRRLGRAYQSTAIHTSPNLLLGRASVARSTARPFATSALVATLSAKGRCNPVPCFVRLQQWPWPILPSTETVNLTS
jgi:hypothetical protein